MSTYALADSYPDDISTLVETTYVKRHEYASGREFWIVTCKACDTVLNSGHHYKRVNEATREANRHNREVHS